MRKYVFILKYVALDESKEQTYMVNFGCPVFTSPNDLDELRANIKEVARQLQLPVSDENYMHIEPLTQLNPVFVEL